MKATQKHVSFSFGRHRVHVRIFKKTEDPSSSNPMHTSDIHDLIWRDRPWRKAAVEWAWCNAQKHHYLGKQI